MKNKWKIAFYSLLGLVVATILLVFILATAPADKTKVELEKDEQGKDDVAFHVKTDKRDLNRVINHYIEEEGKNSKIDYQVKLSDEVELYGTFPFFSEELQLKLSLEPKALDNGDLVLTQKSISIGKLRLPVSTVLKFVQDNYHLPEAVTIKPSEEKVYVSMHKLKLKSDMKVRMDEFDLKKDNIRFTLLVPAE